MSNKLSGESSKTFSRIKLISATGLSFISLGALLYFLLPKLLGDNSSTLTSETCQTYSFGFTFFGIGCLMLSLSYQKRVDDVFLFISGIIGIWIGSIIYLIVPSLIEYDILDDVNYFNHPHLAWYENSAFWYDVGWGFIMIGFILLAISIMISDIKPIIKTDEAVGDNWITSTDEPDNK